MTDTLFLKAALTYAGRGWHVFPLRPRDKRPLTDNGVLDATTDEAKIRRWWEVTPNANIGLATGKSGLVVVDVDGETGRASLDKWIEDTYDAAVPHDFYTVTSHTPTGGFHVLFTFKGDDLAPGVDIFGKGSKVDVRAANSYIVLPPSIHPDTGTAYKWDNVLHPAKLAPFELPYTLHQALSAKKTETRIAPSPDGELIEDGQDAYGARQAAILASKGFSKDEARAALGAMIETRFAGGWEGLDPRRPWKSTDIERWLKGAFAKFYDPDGATTGTTRAEDLQAIDDLMGHLIQTQAAKQRTPLFTAADLKDEEIPPVRWIVGDLLPEGVSIFGGKPKTGKSWLALALAVRIASDEAFLDRPVVKGGEVLYLALEDNKRRLQSRLRKIVGPASKWPRRLTLALEWPRGADSITELTAWLAARPDAALVVIDTLAKVRAVGKNGDAGYSEDYNLVSEYAKLTQDRQIGIVIVTHLRKLDSEDPIDTMQGTLGVTGAADTFYVLKRQKLGADATLYYRGREIESSELPIRFDSPTGTWLTRDDSSSVTSTREQVLEVMRAAIWEMTPAKVAIATGLDADTVGRTMRRMVKDGQLRQTARGEFSIIREESDGTDGG